MLMQSLQIPPGVSDSGSQAAELTVGAGEAVSVSREGPVSSQQRGGEKVHGMSCTGCGVLWSGDVPGGHQEGKHMASRSVERDAGLRVFVSQLEYLTLESFNPQSKER
ncbi:hypothetical protein MHYP_G00326420 [Metynnis hypsauchen]